MKLRQKILLVIVLFIACPMTVIGLFTYNISLDNKQAQVEHSINSQIQQQAFALEHFFKDVNSSLQLLKQDEILLEYIARSEEGERYSILLPQLLDMFSRYATAYERIEEIQLVTKNGFLDAHFSTQFTNLVNDWLHDEPWFEQLEQPLSQTFYYIDPVNNHRKLFATTPLYNSLSNRPFLWGYLLLKINPERVDKLIQKSPSQDGINLLVNAQGLVVSSNKANNLNLTLPEFVRNELINNKGDGKFSEIFFNNQDMSFTTYDVADNFKLIAGASLADITADNQKLPYIILAILLTTMLISSWLVFILIERMILKPIAKLNMASKAIGSGKLSFRLPAKQDDEIGHLFESFNRMVNSLKQANNSLEDYKAHLEEKVKSRTLALQTTNNELREARNIAEQANALKSRFLANMSHEFRTPLTAICGFTEQALLNIDDKALTHQLLDKVLNNSQHLRSLISDVLDLSKIESGKLEVELIPSSLPEILSSVVQIAESMCQQKSLTFEQKMDKLLPLQFVTDPTRLRQILINLIANAVKFTHSGFVKLSVHYILKKQQLTFVVEDSGIGISPEAKKKLFKPFVQADLSTTRNYGGTGLGLALSQSLAQCLNGNISVASELGIGAKFTLQITLPDSTLQLGKIEELKTYELQKQKTLNLQNAHILLVEDNLDNQSLLKLMLNRTGAILDIANNGQEAVEQNLIADYDLILMDMQMPVMGGLEAVHLIRQTGFEGIIIALTANVMDAEIDEYIKNGCDTFIAKPIDSKILYQTLADYLLDNNEAENAIDFEAIEEQINNSEEIKSLRENFTRSLPDILAQIEQAATAKNYQDVAISAHTLKGNSKTLGWPTLSPSAAIIEKAAQQQDNSLIINELNKLRDLLQNGNKES
ncbi:hybrid sensor histidine kinase/response regulator [Catenovulum sediminis]|uniref:hybrid sensor histidine kinase/response regulator n=1 Tax=Catenovulum sediminis TaxID=1740262 RepID=UPI001180FC65|nr:hybrid sensor histidine kinase/response regulator [Catenovulum sediminis]